MTNRENLTAALEGRKPERIPYTIYEDWILGEDLERLMKQGLCVIPYVSVFRETIRDVERIHSTERWNGQDADILTYRTPVGNIRQVSVRGWVQEFFLKTPQDYKVMTHVIRNTQMEADPKPFHQAEERIGENGLTLIWGRRSPIQTMMVDYAGLEAFAFHMADEFPELDQLFDALMDQLIQTCHLVASGPGKYVSLLENMTAEVWGPERFRKYHLPVYETILPILHQGGKKVYAHYDGKLACVADLVAKTALDGIESFTLAPEGDMMYAEARQSIGEKFIWSNISLGLYRLSETALRAHIRKSASEASPDGRLFAFGISEDLPENWKETLQIVLDELSWIG